LPIALRTGGSKRRADEAQSRVRRRSARRRTPLRPGPQRRPTRRARSAPPNGRQFRSAAASATPSAAIRRSWAVWRPYRELNATGRGAPYEFPAGARRPVIQIPRLRAGASAALFLHRSGKSGMPALDRRGLGRGSGR
jgi:hypothetical protein